MSPSPAFRVRKYFYILAPCLLVFVLTSAGCHRFSQAPTKAGSSGLPLVAPVVNQQASGQIAERVLTWAYRGKKFTWSVNTPQQLLDWDRQVNRLTADYYSGKYSQIGLMIMPAELRQLVLADSAQEDGDLTPWVNDDHNSQWVDDLARQLAARARRNGFDYFHTAEFIQSFVCGAIPYQVTAAPEMPAQTLMDNGDCKDKSILLAALLKSLSYRVTLLEFSSSPGAPGHMAVGVAFDDNQLPKGRNLSYYEYQGRKYYFAETTAPNWTLGAASVKEPAHVYNVNQD